MDAGWPTMYDCDSRQPKLATDTALNKTTRHCSCLTAKGRVIRLTPEWWPTLPFLVYSPRQAGTGLGKSRRSLGTQLGVLSVCAVEKRSIGADLGKCESQAEQKERYIKRRSSFSALYDPPIWQVRSGGYQRC